MIRTDVVPTPTGDAFLEELVVSLKSRIEMRVREEVRSLCTNLAERIVQEECAAVAVSISKWVSYKHGNAGDVLTIEIKRPPLPEGVPPPHTKLSEDKPKRLGA